MNDAEIMTAIDGIVQAQKETNAAISKVNTLLEELMRDLSVEEDAEDTF